MATATTKHKHPGGSTDPVRITGAALARLQALIRAQVQLDREGVEQGRTYRNLALRAQMPERTLYRIVNEPTKWVTLRVADQIITHGLGDATLWHTEPELAEVYYAAA